MAKSPTRPKADKPSRQNDVDENGFPISYEEPEQADNEAPAEKRKRQQKLLNTMLPPQSESAPAQIHVVSKAAPKSQPQPAPKPETQPVAKTGSTISKMEAARQALAADPTLSGESGVAYIKNHFGLDLTPSMFSNYKSTINKDARESGSTPAPKAAAPRNAAPKAATAPAAANNVADLIRDVKALLAKHDANSVIAVVEALSE